MQHLFVFKVICLRTLQQLLICLRPAPLLGFCFGVGLQFTGSGHMQSIKVLQNMANTTQLQREVSQREAAWCLAWLGPLSWSAQCIFTGEGGFGYVTVSVSWQDALQRQNNEISKQIFPEKEYRGLSPNFHIHVSVSHLYISTISLSILLEEICRPIL
jgi:hypothetical protein